MQVLMVFAYKPSDIIEMVMPLPTILVIYAIPGPDYTPGYGCTPGTPNPQSAPNFKPSSTSTAVSCF